MEKLNFVKKNGVSRMPPGFRFQPTDEELVFQYLKCKVFSFPLPASMIPDINLSNYDPWDLPGNCDEHQEMYFFSSKEPKYRNGSRMNRTTTSGYWKATGSDKRIISSSNNSDDNSILGIRKTLVFYQGKSPNGTRTHWVLHEYRLVSTTLHANNNACDIGDWVLCRLSVKKRSVGSGSIIISKKARSSPSSSSSSSTSSNNVMEVSSSYAS
ncbi:hypothetical protein HN51_036757 [Arachis hypogaea]|uniref:NAC domain-containing protein n=1 Tax=Arachis hypogaea TaxID=3818 RepID=A0A444ZYC4_ARAHY|nr:NAC domain-containing protein 41 [Arachis ipaensis]XP_025637475.1 NAC domain-containing protein 41 [Arachis hypogaea]QHO02190.1 NAC domain-containing protein [Arachis hypogaea]RYR19231.1 hypothetical protein Ahy_B03g063949 [Arachis hypogaea]